MLLKAIFLVVLLAVVSGVDSLKKRNNLNKTNKDLNDVVEALKERIRILESKQGDLGFRGPRSVRVPRSRSGRSSGGVAYIRWGKTSCPYGASLVYKGRVGGEHYNHVGGGSNYVCLTESPKYWRYTNRVEMGSAYMYGTEYRVKRSWYANPFNKNLHNHEAPCAVCFVHSRIAKLMIPGTYRCPAGWSREYWGYLMTHDYEWKNQKEFICVDQDPELVVGSFYRRNGAFLVTVQGRCGSLPCLPYVEGRELTCAVCTK